MLTAVVCSWICSWTPRLRVRVGNKCSTHCWRGVTFFKSANVIMVGALPIGAICSASCWLMLPVYFRVSRRFSSGVAGLM